MIQKLKRGRSQKLWDEAKKIIPGGSQLLSKRAEMFLPDLWPAYYAKAKGVEITDLDGKKYVDMSLMGIGACVLGYADKDVNAAVKKAIDEGSMSTLNTPEEVELAKELLKITPWAHSVRFARTGGEAMAVAVRIARAFAPSTTIAMCGYHGWHDWYLSVNLASKKNLDGLHLSGLEPRGVPESLVNTAEPFHFNKIEELKNLVATNKIGVIVMEPVRHQEPQNGFLEEVRKIATQINAVLVFDEVSCGFRSVLGGVHMTYGVIPDIVVYGKALGNGFPISAIVGKKDVMDAAQLSFISSTHWTERIGFAAALATIKKMRATKANARINATGKKIWQLWEKAAKRSGLDISLIGPYSLVTFSFNYPDQQELKTLFIQEMLKRGFLATQTVYVSSAHTDKHLAKYAHAVDEVFVLIKKAIDSKTVSKLLEGPVAHAHFGRLT